MIGGGFGLGVAVGVTAAVGWIVVALVIASARRRGEPETEPAPDPGDGWLTTPNDRHVPVDVRLVPSGVGVPGYHTHETPAGEWGHVHRLPSQGDPAVPHSHTRYPETERDAS